MRIVNLQKLVLTDPSPYSDIYKSERTKQICSVLLPPPQEQHIKSAEKPTVSVESSHVESCEHDNPSEFVTPFVSVSSH